MSTAALGLVRVTSPSVDDQHCPKCDRLLDEVFVRPEDAPPERKGRLVGWECRVCGYRDMIRTAIAGRRRA